MYPYIYRCMQYKFIRSPLYQRFYRSSVQKTAHSFYNLKNRGLCIFFTVSVMKCDKHLFNDKFCQCDDKF